MLMSKSDVVEAIHRLIITVSKRILGNIFEKKVNNFVSNTLFEVDYQSQITSVLI